MFAQVSLSPSLFLYAQTSHLSISGFPAVGVACELSPASPYWPRSFTRAVSVLCRGLTWCSADRLYRKLHPSFSCFLAPLLPNLRFWRTHLGWDYCTRLLRHENDLHDKHTQRGKLSQQLPAVEK